MQEHILKFLDLAEENKICSSISYTCHSNSDTFERHLTDIHYLRTQGFRYSPRGPGYSPSGIRRLARAGQRHRGNC